MPALLDDIDPNGMLEYSVVFSDRSLNHMSLAFQEVMRGIDSMLREAYAGDATILIPGGGTYAMEAVARHFATDKKVLVIRNGWFSYRWSQILSKGRITSDDTVLKAQRTEASSQAPFVPPKREEVLATIRREKPDVVFAPHVETSAGLMLPDDYLKQIGDAVRETGGLFVLDCVASGCVWVDMRELSLDIVISAPQKGWSAQPCAGLVVMSDRAIKALESAESSSFAMDLAAWRKIMMAYLNGGHAYHATMPTDALRVFHATMREAKEFGFARLRAHQIALGKRVRASLDSYGVKSVAAPGFEAPGVVVAYTDDDGIHTGKKFAAEGLQIAKGVPLACDEGDDFKTFRLGLFGLDKLYDVEGTSKRLTQSFEKLFGSSVST